jgi:iron-sulfur cluster repair protein YtfE (RIC family)
MTTSGAIDPEILQAIADMTIADLVDSTPATSPILAALGLEVCCDRRPLGVALTEHGIDPEPILAQLAPLADSSLGR